MKFVTETHDMIQIDKVDNGNNSLSGYTINTSLISSSEGENDKSSVSSLGSEMFGSEQSPKDQTSSFRTDRSFVDVKSPPIKEKENSKDELYNSQKGLPPRPRAGSNNANKAIECYENEEYKAEKLKQVKDDKEVRAQGKQLIKELSKVIGQKFEQNKKTENSGT